MADPSGNELTSVFQQAIGLSAGERQALLERMKQENPALGEQLQSLLEHYEEAKDERYLRPPPMFEEPPAGLRDNDARQDQLGDRNLLVGMLALQMEFIGREAFVAAVTAWMTRRSTPLETILLEQKAITAHVGNVLGQLVDGHLAVNQEGVTNFPDLLTDCQTRLKSEDKKERRAEDLEFCVDTDATRPPQSLDPGGRYQLVRAHAKGGLGEVLLAHDTELNRQVAVKRIRKDLANEAAARERFLHEAEVTGGLEHPGVVPVYGLGRYADGQVFYAMRFVRGESLSDAIKRFHARDQAATDSSAQLESRLEFRNLIGRLVDVCHTMQYAHSRGVLHRDLKPANIMLGKYGETVVVDWGLARAMGAGATDAGEDRSLEPPLRPRKDESGSAETQPGRALGTPAFMSPEQAEGRLDSLGPPTDVYGLGATLYTLLAGKPPFAGSRDGVTERVARGEFDPPRQVRRQVPKELEAICLHAMSSDPAKRYAVPGEMAADLERWLADEPVSVYDEPWFPRAARWARHHRAAVASGVFVMVVALIGLTIGTVTLDAANRRTEQARQQALDNLALAESNFERALATVDNYLTTVSEEVLLEEPGLEPLREKLLDLALTYYEEFAATYEDDPRLQEELADAYFRMSSIQRDIGSQSDAEALTKKAIAIYEDLLEAEPGRRSFRLGLAVGLHQLAIVLKDQGMADDAHEAQSRAIGILERLGDKRDAGDDDVREPLVAAVHNLAQIEFSRGNSQEALRAADEAVSLAEELAADSPQDFDLTHFLARVYNTAGFIYWGNQEIDQAIAKLEQSRETLEQLAESASESDEYLSDLGVYWLNYATLYLELEDLDAADRGFQEGIAILENLVDRSPYVSKYQLQMSIMYNNRAVLAEDRKRLDLAVQYYRMSSEILERLLAKSPSYARAREQIVATDNALAWQYATAPVDSVRDGERAVTHALRAAEYSDYQDVDVLDTLAAAYAEAGNFEKAIEWIDQAIEMADEDSVESYREAKVLYEQGLPYRQEDD